MAKRPSSGRVRILSDTAQGSANATPAVAKKPCSWHQSQTVYGTETVAGVLTPPASISDPGVIDLMTPVSYLYASGSNNNFALPDPPFGGPIVGVGCTGSNKILIFAEANVGGGTFQANIAASLYPNGAPANHIVMTPGERVELTWVPADTSPDGSVANQPYWATHLPTSGSCPICPSGSWLEFIS